MASKLEICNLALQRIGVSARIEDLEDDSRIEAELCNAIFDEIRDQVLESMHWDFAKARETLAVLSGVTRSGWAYAYGLPTDLIAVRRLESGVRERSERPDHRIPYAIEASDDRTTKILVTDEDAPELVYTARIEEPEAYTPLFRSAVAWLLASELAIPLEKKQAMADRALKKYELELQRAGASSLDQGHDIEAESVFISGRG